VFDRSRELVAKLTILVHRAFGFDVGEQLLRLETVRNSSSTISLKIVIPDQIRFFSWFCARMWAAVTSSVFSLLPSTIWTLKALPCLPMTSPVRPSKRGW